MTDTLILDRAANALYDFRGARFLPGERRWLPTEGDASSPSRERVRLAEAVRWLQRDSGHPLRVPIGVIGPRAATSQQMAVAESLGQGLGARAYHVLCGGREGVMEAVCRGVAQRGGIAVGLTPDTDPALANPHVTIALATGLGEARNAVIARASHCLIAVGDSYGTVSEVALGLHFGKLVVGLEGAAQLAGVEPVATVNDALMRVDRYVLALA
jgi:uncharacterized protein (TIGR00725 family)